MRRRGGAALVAAPILTLAVAAAAALGHAGSLDGSFGDHGRALAVFPEGPAGASAVAVDRHGEIATAGDLDGSGGGEDFAIALFQPSGLPDGHFSDDGEATVDFAGGEDDEAHGVAFDSRGRVIVAGDATGGTANDFAVLRFKRNGDPDPSFGTDGQKVFSISPGNDNISGMALDSKGRIVVAGESDNGAVDRFAVARLTQAGKLDRSFSGDGIATTKVGDNGFGSGLAIDSKGRIVVFGNTLSGSSEVFAAARYLPDGTLDKSFSRDGKTIGPVLPQSTFARGVTTDAQDRVVGVGDIESGSSTRFAVARYKENGKLDRSFSGDGFVATRLQKFNDAQAVVVDSSNRIVAAGFSEGASEEFGLARYKQSGKLDPRFGQRGRDLIPFGTSGGAEALTIDRQGRLVAAGTGDVGGPTGVGVIRFKG